MFTKPFRIKSNTAVKSSDRKKIRADFLSVFPNVSEDVLSLAIPTNENMSVMKIETHCGEIILVHCVGKKPIIFHIREKLYPTIYLLWMLPDTLIPTFTTWDEVVPKFKNGADLMLPGVIVPEELGLRAYGRLPKSATVVINTKKNKAAVAVGKTCLSSEDMYMAGRRGKCVEIFHCIGDYLWQAGNQDSPPEIGPPELTVPTQFTNSIQPAAVKEDESVKPTEETPLAEVIENVESNDAPSTLLEDLKIEEASNQDEAEQDTRSPQEIMDELLDYCFLKALKTGAKKIELPILNSNFFRLHMVPACPSDKTLDVKKSSYKKLSKYLETMQKEGVVAVKEMSPGVEAITDIQLSHDRIRFFKITDSGEPKPDVVASQPTDKYVPPVITKKYAVNAASLPLFSPGSHHKGTVLTAQEVRHYLTEYVKLNQLQDPANKSQVKLDPILSDVLLKKGEKIEVLNWEDIMTRCLSKLSQVHEMVFNQQAPLLIKGQLEPVEITTASRAGNKKVTLISGLETFRINLEQFARRCQVSVAASTTITSSPAKKGQIVLIQGNQVKFVGKMLVEEYGIPKHFIQGLDLKGKDKNSKK